MCNCGYIVGEKTRGTLPETFHHPQLGYVNAFVTCKQLATGYRRINIIKHKVASVGSRWSTKPLRDARANKLNQRARTRRLALKSDILRFQSVVGSDHLHNAGKGRSRFLKHSQAIIKKQA